MERAGFDPHISAAKGFCAFTIVAFHAVPPQALQHVILFLQLGALIIISGMFLKDEHLQHPGRFIARRFRRLWIPYVLFMLICLFSHNMLANIHLYTDHYSAEQIRQRVFSVLTMQERDNLLGCFWFLKELLYATLFAFVAIKLSQWLLGDAYHPAVMLTVALLVLIVAANFYNIPYLAQIPTLYPKTLLATAIYLCGYVFARTPWRSLSNWFTVAVFTALSSWAMWGYEDNFNTTWWNLPKYFFATMLAAFAIIYFCQMLRGKALSALSYIGEYAMPILLLQFFAFRVVDLLKIAVYDLPIARLADFPIIVDNNQYFWILYTIVGLALPILAANMYDRAKCGIKQRFAQLSKT
ncbi:MAG: acyltransferase [Candidatus Limisoma sp.]